MHKVISVRQKSQEGFLICISIVTAAFSSGSLQQFIYNKAFSWPSNNAVG